ncbi:MAG TPA: hypothetical protein VF092_21235 [Longimicrobium sp.]
MRLAAIVLLAASPLVAQRPTPARNAALGGVRFGVPEGYTLERALSDSAIAIYGRPSTRTWVFVAVLRAPEQRPAIIRTVSRRLGKQVLGGDPDAMEWQLEVDFPGDSAQLFHQRTVSLGGAHSLDLAFRQFRADGRDVLAGSAFVMEPDPQDVMCGATGSGAAWEAEEWLVASLLGRSAPDPRVNQVAVDISDFSGAGGASQPSRPAPPPDPEAARVLEAYRAYLRAIQSHDGNAAAALVTPAVLAFYGDVQQLALYAPAAEVRALPLMQRLMVLSLRHRWEPARLRAATPAELFAAEAVNTPSDTTTQPRAPSVSNGVATVALEQGGRRTSLRMGFVRDRGTWRVDLLPLLAGTGCILRGRMRLQGIPRERDDELLLRMLEMSSGRPVKPGVWNPLFEAPAGPE